MKNIKKSIYLPFWAPFGADFARALGRFPPPLAGPDSKLWWQFLISVIVSKFSGFESTT